LWAHSKNGSMYMAFNYPGQQESCESIGVLVRMQNAGETRSRQRESGGERGGSSVASRAQQYRMFELGPTKTRRCHVRTSQHWSLLSPTRSRSLHLSFSTAKATGSLEAANTGVHAVHPLVISFIRPTRNGPQDQPVRVYSLA
jgi:hypothetical protein